jgi:tetratricopeptide (TPR) repeat protein
VTLASKAWAALETGDIEAVLAYTNKCIELYAEQAKKMQSSLTDYPVGTNQEIFGYWALNDVATCLFIQGEAYRKANMNDEAKEVFFKLTNEYTFGQCWDAKGWFWKPAEAAKEKLATIESGSSLDFGDYTSSVLTTKAWKALQENKLDEVLAYTNKCLELYTEKAKEMQASLKEYPWVGEGETNDKIFAYWALNDAGTCLFIKGEAYKNANKLNEAKAAYLELVTSYFYAQCWDTSGWFWKPSEAAQKKIDEINEGG